ncbi:MAG: GDP-L-fucose synthase [Actinomycetota bacterium]|nr:GDP-L-fucose synthase [Actinomycetota bacterium]
MSPKDHFSGDSKIYVAGHSGLAGSALVRKLEAEGFHNLITRSHNELDLRENADVKAFFAAERPEYVFMAAAKVGGIWANSHCPAEFIRDNLLIETSVIHNAYISGVKKLLFLGSSCIYPKKAPQPIKEEYLLTGPLEPTNDAYALAKIAGIKMCQSYNYQYGTNFISVMPTNLYGPNDNFDLKNSHVLPALIRKFHEAKAAGAKSVEVWGSGNPRREFLHVDDLADACLFLMRSYNSGKLINIGVGQDISIKELALLIKEVAVFTGDISFDASKPDGMPRKLLDVAKLNSLGWQAAIGLREGLKSTYQWYSDQAKPLPPDKVEN